MQTPRKRRLVFLLGPSGSGKSALAKLLAPRLGYSLVDTDTEIERLAKTTIKQIFDTRGESYFRELERQLVATLVANASPSIVATGGGLPVIPGMLTTLKEHGLTVYLKAGLGTLWGRLTAHPDEIAKRPLLINHGPDGLKKLLDDRHAIYEQADSIFETDALTAEEVCAAIAGLVESSGK
jgi:shikimate kinase